MRCRARIADASAIVVGLGGVGRQLAMQLAALGVGRLWLVDAGRVSRRRVAVECYFADDVGHPKRHATAQLCHLVNPELEVSTSAQLSPRRLTSNDVLFACEPGAAAEHAIRAARPNVRYYIRVWAGQRGVRVTVTAGARPRVDVPRIDRERALQVVGEPGSHTAALAAGLAVREFVRLVHR
jgi:sulfur carrier protein ThiS adenylyltransferase